ncbi:MAG: DUF2797 domain-containing protein [Candidatus Thermoplasmatota archaeon]|nr:DUF2797 domain-containing protein [Candidatus Thermoplasmatota archaeon]
MMESNFQALGIGIPHERCLEMTLDMVGHDAACHVLGYSWTERGPLWTLLPLEYTGGKLFPASDPIDIELFCGFSPDFRVSSASYCVGRFDDGRYLQCPDLSKVSIFPQCPSCMAFEIPDPECIFEPHCNMGSCGAKFCQVEHVVYLTAFRNRFKVGMTQLRRYRERGLEQGADMILPLLVLGDRYSARKIEERISRFLGLPQAVISGIKLKGWALPPREEEVRKGMLSLKERLMKGWGAMEGNSPDIHVVRAPDEFEEEAVRLDYPLKEPLKGVPRIYKGPIVKGKLVGFKGNYMIFDSGGLRAFRIGETPGKVVYFSVGLE